MNSNAPEPLSGAKAKTRSTKSIGAPSADVGWKACASDPWLVNNSHADARAQGRAMTFHRRMQPGPCGCAWSNEDRHLCLPRG